MRYAVISDIHSNIQALQQAFQEIEKLDVDEIICLGDVVGYNANPIECVELLRANKKVSHAVIGNHDRVCAEGIRFGEASQWGEDAFNGFKYSTKCLKDEHKEYLSSLPVEELVEDDIYPFMIRHSSFYCEYNPDGYILCKWDAKAAVKTFDRKPCNIGFFGHTHYPSIIKYNVNEDLMLECEIGMGILGSMMNESEDPYEVVFDVSDVEDSVVTLVNPGAIGQTRGSDNPSFALLDTETSKVSIIFYEYNYEAAQKAIMESCQLPLG